MKILHITSHLNIGGVTRYVLSLSDALTRRGHQLTIAADHGQLETELSASGLTYWRVPFHTSAEFSLQVFTGGRELARQLRRHPVDVIHAHTRVGQVVADRLAKHFRIPYVTTWHGFFGPNLGRRLWPCLGDRTIAISNPVRDHLRQDFGVPAERIRTIPNGVDVDYFLKPPDAVALDALRARWRLPAGQRVIGGLGRLASGRVKGFDLLLAAAAHLQRDFLGLQVILVGDGPRLPFLQERAKHLGIREQVHFVGAMPDTRVPLALMDVFVFPSRWQEGFGLSLIEAMAAGKPVVASRVGATPDIVEHGRSGWLVPPEDPRSLAEGIARLLRDPATAAQFGAEAQRRVREQFSLERVATEVEAVYRELVKTRGVDSP